jgi:hypothetical protein
MKAPNGSPSCWNRGRSSVQKRFKVQGSKFIWFRKVFVWNRRPRRFVRMPRRRRQIYSGSQAPAWEPAFPPSSAWPRFRHNESGGQCPPYAAFHALRVGPRPISNCYEKFLRRPYSGRAAVPGRLWFRRALKARPTGFFQAVGGKAQRIPPLGCIPVPRLPLGSPQERQALLG